VELGANPLLWAACRAFLACLILTPIVRDVFRIYGLVDHPDRARKVHAYPIPRVGGIPIMIAYAFALYQFAGEKTPLTEYAPMAWKLTPAVLMIFATGLIDDFFGLEPWQKLAGQLAAAGLACWAGVRVFGIAGYAATWWSIPLTVAWLIVCTNAFNLVDGLDGLAAGMGLVAALTISAAALMAGNPPLAYASVPLAGALLGFLCYNLTPATIFLGDSGSLLIGFLLGCYGAVWSQKSATLIGITIPVLALSIPLLDIILAIVRRFLRNQPIFSADRGHIHHRLLERGLTPRRAVLVLYLVCALAAGFALVVALPYGIHEGGGRRYYGFAILALGAAAVLGIRQLRYAEFGLASRLLFGGEFQRTLGGQMQLERLAEELGQAQTEKDCWRLIASAAREFGFDRAQLSLRGQCWEENFRDVGSQECWSLRVPLGGGPDALQLERPFESDVLPMMVARFLDTVRRGVQAKLQEWDEQPVA